MSGEGTALAESLSRVGNLLLLSVPLRVEVAPCAQQRRGGVPREGTGFAQVTLTVSSERRKGSFSWNKQMTVGLTHPAAQWLGLSRLP